MQWNVWFPLVVLMGAWGCLWIDVSWGARQSKVDRAEVPGQASGKIRKQTRKKALQTILEAAAKKRPKEAALLETRDEERADRPYRVNPYAERGITTLGPSSFDYRSRVSAAQNVNRGDGTAPGFGAMQYGAAPTCSGCFDCCWLPVFAKVGEETRKGSGIRVTVINGCKKREDQILPDSFRGDGCRKCDKVTNTPCCVDPGTKMPEGSSRTKGTRQFWQTRCVKPGAPLRSDRSLDREAIERRGSVDFNRSSVSSNGWTQHTARGETRQRVDSGLRRKAPAAAASEPRYNNDHALITDRCLQGYYMVSQAEWKPCEGCNPHEVNEGNPSKPCKCGMSEECRMPEEPEEQPAAAVSGPPLTTDECPEGFYSYVDGTPCNQYTPADLRNTCECGKPALEEEDLFSSSLSQRTNNASKVATTHQQGPVANPKV